MRLVPHRLIYLVPSCWTREGLGGVALLRRYVTVGLALRFQKPTSFPVCFLSLSVLCLWIRCKLSAMALALCVPAAAKLPAMMAMDSPSESMNSQ